MFLARNRQSGYSLFEVSLGAAVALVVAGSLLNTFGKAMDQVDELSQATLATQQLEALRHANATLPPPPVAAQPGACDADPQTLTPDC